MAQFIVLHVSPDWDAICSLWLLNRFGPFQDAEIVLVNTGNPDPAVLAEAAAVVDTGGVYDQARWRFDHHQFTDGRATSFCAALQVYIALLERSEAVVFHLRPLVGLVHAGDVGDPSARWSREHGIHAVLSAWKTHRSQDEAILSHGFQLLDEIAGMLETSHDLDTAVQTAVSPYAADIAAYRDTYSAARTALEEHIAYRSDDGLIVALDNAPQAASQAAFEAGARLVLFHSEYPDIPTVAVGCQRSMEWQTPHIGELVSVARATDDTANEMGTWFCHPAGFFAGRGTPKAPDARPLRVSVADIAAVLDAAWRR